MQGALQLQYGVGEMTPATQATLARLDEIRARAKAEIQEDGRAVVAWMLSGGNATGAKRRLAVYQDISALVAAVRELQTRLTTAEGLLMAIIADDYPRGTEEQQASDKWLEVTRSWCEKRAQINAKAETYLREHGIGGEEDGSV